MNDRTERKFSLRSDAEQRSLLNNTWCYTCVAADLGISNPREYELDGVVYVESDCNQCGNPIVSEIVDRESSDQ